MRKQLLAICLAIMMTMPAYAGIAEYKQIITINGETLEKVATELTFDGDNVILHFSNNSTQACDMADVSIAFEETTGIQGIKAFNLKGITTGVFEIEGLESGQTVQIFDVTGKKVYGAKAASDTLKVDISTAKAGTYILRAGNNVVKFKFVKR